MSTATKPRNYLASCLALSALALVGAASVPVLTKRDHNVALALERQATHQASTIIRTESVDSNGVIQYTTCSGGWCVTDTVPVDPVDLEQKPISAIGPVIDIAAVIAAIQKSEQQPGIN